MTNPALSMPEGMTLALDQAKAAAERGEVPVGAALFDENGVLVTAFGNQVEQDRDPTAHA
jgi:tRNA(adenine34) deaminase